MAANAHDRQVLYPLMENFSAEERKQLLADKGYPSKENDPLLEAMGSASLVMEKSDCKKPLTKPQKERNKAIKPRMRGGRTDPWWLGSLATRSGDTTQGIVESL